MRPLTTDLFLSLSDDQIEKILGWTCDARSGRIGEYVGELMDDEIARRSCDGAIEPGMVNLPIDLTPNEVADALAISYLLHGSVKSGLTNAIFYHVVKLAMARLRQ